jgi:hypothetical protein
MTGEDSMTFLPKRYLVVILLFWILSIGAIYFVCSATPTREFSSGDWFAAEKPRLKAVDIDQNINGMVQRAKNDYLLHPLPNLRGRIVFSKAWTVDPDDLYLVFWPSGTPDIKIVYRCARNEKRLLWKAVM